MRVRRRSLCFLQIDEELVPDLAGFLRGSIELLSSTRIAMLCPLSGQRIRLSPDELRTLCRLPAEWTGRDRLDADISGAVLDSLCARGVLLSDQDARALLVDAYERESELVGWHPIASIYHGMTKWTAVVAADLTDRETDTPQLERLERMVELHGTVPSHIHVREDVLSTHRLPGAGRNTSLDTVLLSRKTTRHYRPQAELSRWQLGQVLGMTFGFTGAEHITPSMTAMKRTSPSGGALHPIEAYSMILGVEGIPCGVHHYDAHTHELRLLREFPVQHGRRLASELLIGQHFFSDAAALIFHVARVDRHHWKYRHHPKAYKALLLDCGHLSQTFYLKATELGLGCFFTAAINDADVESLFGLDPANYMVIGANGLGITDMEKDHLHLAATPIPR